MSERSHLMKQLAIPEKRILTLAAAALIALVAIAVSIAFTVRTIDADNMLTFGSVRMQVLEYELDSDGDEIVFDQDTSTKASTSEISRIVRFLNTGSSPQYVRAHIAMKGYTAAGEELSTPAAATFAINDDIWTRGDDGWYYYLGTTEDGGIVQAGAETANLITSLRFASGASGLVGQDGTYKLVVEAQAVQVANNGDSALTAQGWPEDGGDA